MSDRSAVEATGGTYVLGHTARELERLARQARLIDPITERFLKEAGIVAGMRVLDIGSGAGHVSFIAADLVGSQGRVVGVDRSGAAVRAADKEAKARSIENVSFREGDPAKMVFERPFDAVIGRYVLQFQPKPEELLRGVAAHVRPGGLVVFHELDWSSVRSFPSAPTFDMYCGLLAKTLKLGGAETSMGIKLHATFLAAGLPDPCMRMEALIGGGTHSSDVVQKMVDLAETLAPAMQRFGVTPAGTVAGGDLVDVVTNEVLAGGCVLVGHMQVGCWSRI